MLVGSSAITEVNDLKNIYITVFKFTLEIFRMQIFHIYSLNDNQSVLFSLVQEMAGWLLLAFLICLHNQLSSIIHCINTYYEYIK